jgi:Arc/MetJ-type ribon-helix-helix transcriptional regulator
MTDAENAHRGQEAARLLESDVMREALQALESEIVAQWEQCPARDKEGKEALWQLLKTKRKFERLLLGYVETGKLARENLRRIEEGKLARMLRRA